MNVLQSQFHLNSNEVISSIFCFFWLIQNKDKLEKLRGQAETFCHRLGRYRMPFAWATINIMEVISTAALDRDVTDSDSLKGGVFVLVSHAL